MRSRAVGMAVGAGSLWVVDRLVNGVTCFDLANPQEETPCPRRLRPARDRLRLRGALGRERGRRDRLGPAAGHFENADDPGLSEAVRNRGREGAIWVGSNTSSSVTRIDPRTGREVARISVLRRGLGFSGLYDVAVGAGSVWAVNNDAQEIAKIDPRTNRVIAHIKLPVSPRVISVAGMTSGSRWRRPTPCPDGRPRRVRCRPARRAPRAFRAVSVARPGSEQGIRGNRARSPQAGAPARSRSPSRFLAAAG